MQNNLFEYAEYNNTFVSVKIDHNTTNFSITCEFYTQPTTALDNNTNNYNCSCITYGINKSQLVIQGTSYSSIVTLKFNIHTIQEDHRHFTIIATDGTDTVWVEGKFNTSGKFNIG